VNGVDGDTEVSRVEIVALRTDGKELLGQRNRIAADVDDVVPHAGDNLPHHCWSAQGCT
jgi:hypothetical protein